MYLVHALLYCSLIVSALKNVHSNISSTRNVKISKRSYKNFLKLKNVPHGKSNFNALEND